MRADGIITLIVDFVDGAEAYRAIDERPQESINLGIQFLGLLLGSDGGNSCDTSKP
jgi:hypothetical protein